MKCVIDKNECIGCGLCGTINSEVFTEDTDGKYKAKSGELTDKETETALDAVDSCPTAAISIIK